MAKSKKVPACPIPERQYERFKNKLEEISSEALKDRNIMLFILGIATGYRAQDITDLTIAQIQEALDYGEFVIQEKKQYNEWKKHKARNPNSTKKKPDPRVHSVEGTLEKMLRKYIKGKKKSEYAFPSQKGDYIRPKAFSDILKEVAEELRLKNITGHSMRKTYARRLWEETKDLEFVRIALGHKSIEVTKRYLGLENEVKMDAAKIAANKL